MGDDKIVNAMDAKGDQQSRLADRLMAAHWSWHGNKPTGYMVTDRNAAMALAKIAIDFLEIERWPLSHIQAYQCEPET